MPVVNLPSVILVINNINTITMTMSHSQKYQMQCFPFERLPLELQWHVLSLTELIVRSPLWYIADILPLGGHDLNFEECIRVNILQNTFLVYERDGTL